MLETFPKVQGGGETAGQAAPESPRPVWFDLESPSESEQNTVERTTGLRVPTRSQLDEIESSSRLYTEDGTLYLSMPAISRGSLGEPVASSVGFVLSPQYLISVRFAKITAFQSFAERFVRSSGKPPTGMDAFIGLLEALVDRMADVLEQIGVRLDQVSDAVFHADEIRPARGVRAEAVLRRTLRAIGRTGDHVSKIRDSLLGIGRIVSYVVQTEREWIPKELKPRFQTLRQDIASLRDYDEHLSNKVQFLLDATLGFINIEQNTIIKILTVASVVGIPPTLLAGIYGMNFKNMPELEWKWGYAYGWAFIILSAVIPLAWFRIRRWI